MLRYVLGAVSLVFSLLLMQVPAWSAPAVPGFPIHPSLVPITFNTDLENIDTNEIFRIVNNARQRAALAPLRGNKALANIAEQRAADMAVRQYYAHKNPDGHYYYDYFRQYGINPTYSCENLDLVFVPNSDAVVQEWLSSSIGHKECLLRPEVVEAGYATTAITLNGFNGTTTTVYVVVAIHTTPL